MVVKKYYTVDELDKDINEFIEENANDLIIQLRKKRKIEAYIEIYA